MTDDLKVCERHLENVLRVNKNIEVELSKFKEVNKQAIKKLQEPMRDVSNTTTQMNRTSGKWSTASRMTATGGGLIDWNKWINDLYHMLVK